MIEIYQGVIVFTVAFVVTLLMVPASKRIAVAIGAIDYPGNRRMNTVPVPRCGGIALYCGLLAACFSMYLGIRFFGWEAVDLYAMKDVNYLVLFLGVTVMFTVGLVDDIAQLTPRVKLCGQIIAAIIVVLAGISISTVRSLADGEIMSLGWLDYPLTVIYLVAFVNVINLIDGLDGLAAGIVAIISMSLLYLVFMRGSFTLAVICIALVAVCIAFLCFNFPPASVFMGDSGSHLLGLVVGIVAISGIVRAQSLVVLLVPIIIAGVPVLDTLSAIIRRMRGNQPVREGDTNHIHHRLMRAGLGRVRSVLVLYLCSAILAVIGIMLSESSDIAQWIILAVLAVVIFFVIWKFGLFKPVLKHYYDNKGRKGPRRSPGEDK